MKKNYTESKRGIWRIIVLLVIFLSITRYSYAEEWQYTSGYMDISANVETSISIIPLEDSWEAESIDAELSVYPRERETQTITSFETSPNADEKENYLLFEWEDSRENNLDINVNSLLRIEENRPEIKTKVSFPVNDIPSSYEEYLEPTENIESDDYSIMQTASSIVEGEDDMFEAMYLIGRWVNENVEYKLDEYTEGNVQSAKWVFENRYGACDEISNLFIAMARSLGVPARYVAGYAYTNLDNLNDFGSHAWAEVYFPGYGWVPFDVTYGQFGFTDLSHVNMGEKTCSSEGAITTTALGRNIQISAEQPDADIDIIEKNGIKEPDADIIVGLVKEEVDFGSYDVIYADIKNERNYYIAFPVYISNNEKIELFSQNEQYIILKPGESRRIFWKAKISENLDRNFYYTLPLQIYTLDGEIDESSITARYGRTFLSGEDADSIITGMSEEEEKEYSKSIEITCESESFAYFGEDVELNCSIRNTGNVFIEGLDACIDDCKTVDIGIGRTANVEFIAEAKESMNINAKNSQVSKTEYIDIEILDYPNVKISNINYPAEVRYDDVFYINFSLDRESVSNPVNVSVNIKGIIEEYRIEKLEGSQKINVKVKASNLNEGENIFVITADYKDMRGKDYHTSETAVIKLEKLNLGQKITSLFNKANRWLNSFFD